MEQRFFYIVLAYFAAVNPFTDNLNYGQTTSNVVQKQLDVFGQGTIIIEMDQAIPFTLKLKPARSKTYIASA